MVKTQLPLQGSWVPSLVRELKSHILHIAAKKKKKKKRKKEKKLNQKTPISSFFLGS